MDIQNNKRSQAKYISATHGSDNSPAISLIRQKLEHLYAHEPSSKQFYPEPVQHPSKHQAYMQSLVGSGKGLAEIQTAWHNYYTSLSDKEKHEVWQEFYARHGNSVPAQQTSQTTIQQAQHLPSITANNHQPMVRIHADHENIRHNSSDAKTTKRHSYVKKVKQSRHIRSLIFGLGCGAIFLIIAMFGFFNDRFIAPFIQPSRAISDTPIILPNDPAAAVSKDAKIIIPKISIEAPIVYDISSNSEAVIQKNLERGIIHYPSTVNPGEQGNTVYFGHSSNNIFNPGDYKFVFVNLRKLKIDDTFIINFNSKRYMYKVFNTKVVEANDVGVLSEKPRPNMATLITCDPPGTSQKRLIVQAEQISPDPSSNTSSKTGTNIEVPKTVPGNAPSLWSRLINSVF